MFNYAQFYIKTWNEHRSFFTCMSLAIRFSVEKPELKWNIKHIRKRTVFERNRCNNWVNTFLFFFSYIYVFGQIEPFPLYPEFTFSFYLFMKHKFMSGTYCSHSLWKFWFFFSSRCSCSPSTVCLHWLWTELMSSLCRYIYTHTHTLCAKEWCF